MQGSEHYNAQATYQGYPHDDEDWPLRDLTAREYRAAEEDGTPIATIEVRRCEKEAHLIR